MDWVSPIKDFFNLALPILDKVPFVRAIIGTILVFFLPGFASTLVFFRELHLLERVALSIGLSIALVTLSVLFTNIVFHIRITGLNALLTIIIITVIPLAIYYTGKYLSEKRNRAD